MQQSLNAALIEVIKNPELHLKQTFKDVCIEMLKNPGAPVRVGDTVVGGDDDVKGTGIEFRNFKLSHEDAKLLLSHWVHDISELDEFWNAYQCWGTGETQMQLYAYSRI